MNNLKVEGKVSDWCPKCKNCKGATRESNGVHNWLTEVECIDPYDGMTKTLNADSDICCSMFEPKPDRSCDKISSLEDELKETKELLYKTRVMYSVLKKEKEELNMPSEARESIAKLNNIIFELEKEKAAHLKDIERLDEDYERIAEKNKRAEAYIKNLKNQLEETQRKLDRNTKANADLVAKLLTERDNLRNENASLNTINKGLAEDRKKLINYMRSLKIASENYLKEFTYEED
jgi:chromosome segregation ATPase